VYSVWWENLKKREHRGDPTIDGMIIIRQNFRNWDVDLRSGLG
jgi:hypothetical protein